MASSSMQDSGPYATMSCAGATYPSHPVSDIRIDAIGSQSFLLHWSFLSFHPESFGSHLSKSSMGVTQVKQGSDVLLCGYGLLMLILTSPLNWVQFLVTSNGLELYAGLWTLCHHELCWSHIPKPPYYIQYSRACFILSTLPILRGLGWLFSSCFPERENMITNLDLKVSMLSFISATCLFFSLYLFLQQVQWHARCAMDVDFLWLYYLNWLSDNVYMCAGESPSPRLHPMPEG
uniref:transmembrane protein 202-like n=1 Tax=Jaculus jaculus TaxID=51337 RepID=UPI001E1B491C|nr:transmembrane protein 202-like [Jaculus jaculus]